MERVDVRAPNTYTSLGETNPEILAQVAEPFALNRAPEPRPVIQRREVAAPEPVVTFTPEKRKRASASAETTGYPRSDAGVEERLRKTQELLQR